MYEAKKKKEKLYRRDSFFHRKNSVHCVHVLQCICCNTANLQKYHPFFSLFSESRFFPFICSPSYENGNFMGSAIKIKSGHREYS